MRILVANPPAYINNYERHFIQAGSRWSFSIKIPKWRKIEHYQPYPFFLGYTSALLKRDTEAKVKAIDACALDFDEKDFINYIASYDPDLLIIEVPTVSFPLVMPLLKDVKERTGCRIAVAGSHITALTRRVMEEYSFIDFGLLGEYELTAKELAFSLQKGGGFRGINGLAFRKKGRAKINGRRQLIKHLDYLPFPDRDDLPVQYYHDFEIAGKPCVQMLSSRGCPFSCIFCLERHVVYGFPIYRRRKPSKVVDEIEDCISKYKVKQVYFDDMTMTIDKKHVLSIAQEILNRKIDIPWTCMGDVNLDYETLKLMAKSGCMGIKFGVETINPSTLRSINKTFVGVEKVKKFVEMCKKLGIWTHATYMIGLPNDTKEGILTTIKFALELDTDSAQFSIATPFPGTPFFELAKRNNWLVTLDWTRYDGANYSVVSYPHLSKDEIEALYHYACEKWRLIKESESLIGYYLKHPLEAFRKARKLGIRKVIELTRYELSSHIP